MISSFYGQKIAVYFGNNTKVLGIFWEKNHSSTVIGGGMYSYHFSLKSSNIYQSA
jgi:trans-2-enoyl-CoA reductase